MSSVELFDVRLDNLSASELKTKLQEFLASGETHLVVTPNPEMLLAAERDSSFKQILKNADLKIPDGFGLVLAARFLFGAKLNRWPGVEVMDLLCQIASEPRPLSDKGRDKRGASVFLLGAAPGVAEQAGERLKRLFPKLKIAGVLSEPDLEIIDQAKPAVLLAAFGHGKQEKWLAENLPKLPSVRIGLGVGGSFDFISGRVKRAPRLLRRLGLEWLWRLLLQPRRWRRIARAVFVFPYLVWLHKKQLALPYRQNVSGFILTRDGQFVIFKRCDIREYWQTPQGGVNPGESAEEALLREVGEEIGNRNLKILFKGEKRYRYNWNIKLALKKGWRGQEQTIFLLLLEDEPKNIKCDQRELCGYKVVKSEEMPSKLHPVRREAFKILLEETGGDFTKFLN